MLDIVKETFYINVHHEMQTAALYKFIGLCDSVFCTSAWAKAVVPLMEFRLTDWFHHLKDTLLYQSVHDGRDTQWSCLAIGLRDFHTSYRLWDIVF